MKISAHKYGKAALCYVTYQADCPGTYEVILGGSQGEVKNYLTVEEKGERKTAALFFILALGNHKPFYVLMRGPGGDSNTIYPSVSH